MGGFLLYGTGELHPNAMLVRRGESPPLQGQITPVAYNFQHDANFLYTSFT